MASIRSIAFPLRRQVVHEPLAIAHVLLFDFFASSIVPKLTISPTCVGDKRLFLAHKTSSSLSLAERDHPILLDRASCRLAGCGSPSYTTRPRFRGATQHHTQQNKIGKSGDTADEV